MEFDGRLALRQQTTDCHGYASLATGAVQIEIDLPKVGHVERWGEWVELEDREGLVGTAVVYRLSGEFAG